MGGRGKLYGRQCDQESTVSCAEAATRITPCSRMYDDLIEEVRYLVQYRTSSRRGSSGDTTAYCE